MKLILTDTQLSIQRGEIPEKCCNFPADQGGTFPSPSCTEAQAEAGTPGQNHNYEKGAEVMMGIKFYGGIFKIPSK